MFKNLLKLNGVAARHGKVSSLTHQLTRTFSQAVNYLKVIN